MPTLSITLTAAQVARIRSALNVSTQTEVEILLKQYLQESVATAEARTDANSKYDSVRSEVW